MKRAAIAALVLAASLSAVDAAQKCCKPASGGGAPEVGILEHTTDVGSPRTLPSWASLSIDPFECGEVGGVWGAVTVCLASDPATHCDEVGRPDCNQQGQMYNTHHSISPSDGAGKYWYFVNYQSVDAAGNTPGINIYEYDIDDDSFVDKGPLATSGAIFNDAPAAPQWWWGQTNRGNLYATLNSHNALVYRCTVTTSAGPWCNSPTTLFDLNSAAAQTALDVVVNGDWSGVSVEVAHSNIGENVFGIAVQDGPSGAQAGCIVVIIAGPSNVWNCFGAAQTGGGGDGDGDIYVSLSGDYAIKTFTDSLYSGTSQAELTINQTTGAVTLTQVINDQDGGWGHNYVHWVDAIADDNFATAGAERIWRFGTTWIASDTPSVRDFPASNGNGDEVFRPASESEGDYVQPHCQNGVNPSVTALADQYCGNHVIGSGAGDCSVQRNCEVLLFRPDGSDRVIACAPSFADTAAGTGTGEGTGGIEYYRAPKPSMSRDGKLVIMNSNLGSTRMQTLLFKVEDCGTRLLAWDGSRPKPLQAGMSGSVAYMSAMFLALFLVFRRRAR